MFSAILRHPMLVLLHQTLRPRSRATDLRTILRTYGSLRSANGTKVFALFCGQQWAASPLIIRWSLSWSVRIWQFFQNGLQFGQGFKVFWPASSVL